MRQIGRSIKSIALFAPNRSALYVSGLLGLRKQFALRGIDTHIGWSYFDPDQLAQFCDLYRPDAILEIDRTRDNAVSIPKDVISVAWIQDWRSMSEDKIGSSSDRFGGSDLYYFCAKPETVGVDARKLKHWGYLLQATDPDVYFAEDVPEESDFSLIGYIPPKLHLAQVDHPLGVELLGPPMNTTDFGTVRQLLDALRAEGLTWNKYDAALARRIANRHICSFIDKRFGCGMNLGRTNMQVTDELMPLVFDAVFDPKSRCLVPDMMMYTVENEIMRAIGRANVVNAALNVSQSLRLYGIGMWQTYPEYLPYYQGTAPTEAAVRRIYRSSRLNLHNAMTQMHARVLDCMAAGSTIMVNKMLHNDADEPDCLKAHFDTDLHYFEYDDDDLEERARDLLQDNVRRRRAGRAAAEVVRSRHTWSHRVDQILSDLAQL